MLTFFCYAVITVKTPHCMSSSRPEWNREDLEQTLICAEGIGIEEEAMGPLFGDLDLRIPISKECIPNLE